jgi:hypothetical protein
LKLAWLPRGGRRAHGRYFPACEIRAFAYPTSADIGCAASQNQEKEETDLSSQRRFLIGSLFTIALVAVMPGRGSAADITIKLGNAAPYSGPASAYSTIARAEAPISR